MAVLLAAFALDCAVGDPRSRFHPVVWIGNLIAMLEKYLRREAHTSRRQIVAGALLVAIVLAVSYGTTAAILYTAYVVSPWMAFAAASILLSVTISPKSLAQAGNEIRDLLMTDRIVEAREKVGWIVGRDTKTLDVGGVTRATVETIAENIVDGIISPLFYFCIGGVALAVMYRAVNTMDSMIAYKNEKYLYFGRVAAWTDDIFNWIPARLTAVLIVLTAALLRMNCVQAARSICRDARRHPSPNSGYSEAGVAGALGVRLGGYNSYFGIVSFRAYMGEPKNELRPIHITRTIRVMYGVTVLFIVAALAIAACIGRGAV